MISSNYYKCSEAELINNVFKGEMICEIGDKKLMQWCRKSSRTSVDWCRHLDIDKFGCISKDSFYSSAILMKKNNSKFTVLMNSEHNITKIHSDVYGILNDSGISKKCDIILFLSSKENYEGAYLTKLLKTISSCRRENNTGGNIFVYLRDPGICIFIVNSNMVKNPLSSCKSIKKIELVEYINEMSKNIFSASVTKYKNIFVNIISKYIQVIPYSTYLDTYNESFRFTTIVIMDNRSANRWLTMSIVNTNKPISSSRLKICSISDKDISYTSTNNFDSYIKSGFCAIDFSDMTSVSKINSFVKELISSIEKIYPDILAEIKYYSQSTYKSKNEKKVRFSTKLYVNIIDSKSPVLSDSVSKSKPSCCIKKYKNGRPVGILKKKSRY